jgi:hypothetical protein
MIRSVLVVGLCVVVSLTVVATATFLAVSHSAWGRDKLRDVIAQQLANYTNRQVQMGRVEGDLLTGVTVHDLALSEGASLRNGAVATVDELQAHFNIVAVLQGRIATAASIRDVTLIRPRVKLQRYYNGRTNVDDLIKRKVPTRPEDQFRGQVHVRDGSVDFSDARTVLRNGAPLFVRARELQGEGDFSVYGRIAARVSAVDADGRFGRVEGGIVAAPKPGYYSVFGAATGADGAYVYRAVAPPSSQVQALYGLASGSFSVSSVPTRKGKKTSYTVRAQVSDGAMRIAALGPDPVTVTGSIGVSPAGLQVESADIKWADQPVHVSGSVLNFASPVANLRVSGKGVELRKVQRFLSADQRKTASAFAGLSAADVDADIVGPTDHLNLLLHLSAAGRVAYANRSFGAASIVNPSIDVAVWDMKKPAAVVTASNVVAKPEDLGPLLAGAHARWPKRLTASDVRSPRVSVVIAGGKAVAGGLVTAATVQADDLHAENARAKVVWAGDAVFLEDLEGRAMSAQVRGRAVIDAVPGEGLRTVLRLSAEGVDARNLKVLPVHVPQGLSGLVDLTVFGTHHARMFHGLARVRVVGGHYKGLRFDTGSALLQIDGGDLTVTGGHVSSEEGTLWAHGTYDRGGNYKFTVTGAEVDVAKLAEAASTPVSGRVYGHAIISGRGLDWHADGDVFAFGPGYEHLEGDLLVAKVSGGPTNFTVPRLLMSRGNALLAASGTLSDFDVSAPSKASIDAKLHVSAVPLREVLKSAGVPIDANGYAEITATARGPLERPTVDGVATTGYATYKDFAIDSIRAPFHLSDDALVVDDFAIQAGDGRLSGGGRVDHLREKPHYAASFAGSGLMLEKLAPLHERNIDAVGEVRMPFAEIQGTADDLTGRARVVAPSIAFGGGAIRNLDGTFVLDKDHAQLIRGEFDLTDPSQGSGHMSASGSYDWRAGMVNATASATGLPVAQAVRTIRPIVWMTTTEGGVSSLRGRPTPTLLAGGTTAGVGTSVASAMQVAPGLPAPGAGPHTTPPGGQGPTSAAQTSSTGTREGVDQLLGSLGAWAGGQLSGEVSLSGPTDSLESTFQLELAKRVHDGVVLPTITIGDKENGGVRYSWADRTFHNIKVEEKRGNALVTVSGPLLQAHGQVSLTAEASGLDLATVGDWLPYEAQTADVMSVLGRIRGQVETLTAVVQGDLRAPTVRASADITDGSIAGAHFDLASAPLVSIKEGGINIDSLVLKRGDRQIIAGAKLPFHWQPASVPGNEPVEVALAIKHTPLKFISSWVHEYTAALARTGEKSPVDWWANQTEESGGSVDADVKLVGTAKSPQLQGTVTVSKAAFDIGGTTLPVRDLNGELTFTPRATESIASLRGLKAKIGGATVDAGGDVTLRSIEKGAWDANNYDLTGTVRMTTAPATATQQPVAIAEKIGFRTEDGAVSTRRHVLTLTNLDVPKDSTRLDLSGTASFQELQLSRLAYGQWDVKASLEKAYAKMRDAFEGYVSAKLEAKNPAPGEPVLLSAQATISDGRVTLPAGPLTTPTALYAASSRFPNPSLDITLAIGDNVAFEGNLQGLPVRIPLEPYAQALRAVGTPQKPVVVGRVEAQRGWASLPVSVASLGGGAPTESAQPNIGFGVTIDELAFLYQLGPGPRSAAAEQDRLPLKFTSQMWGRGERIIQGVVIGGRQIDQLRLLFSVTQEPPSTGARRTTAAGAVPTFNVNVTSDPPLGRDEINRIIGTQLAADPLFGIAEGLKLSVFKPIEERLRNALGLSELSLNFQFTQAVDMRIGKYVIKHLYVSYRRTLSHGEPQQQEYLLTASYQLPSKMLLSIATDDRGDKQFHVGYGWQF